MLAENIKKIIDQARDILVGMVPDPKGQIDQITNALIYKFMNDMDKAAEEMGGKPAYFTNGMEKFAWHNLFDSKLDNQQKTLQYSEGIRKFSEAEHLPSLFREIFKDASVTFHAPDTVSLFLDEINKFPPYQSNSENLGTAFEYLLHFMGTQGKAGQFRTPRHIINFIVDVVAPHKSDTILDPACGTAGFLISAYKYIINNFQLTQREISTLAKNIKGIDIDPQMAKLARVNLYLHGFKQPQILGDDTLTNKNLWENPHLVILANPPFMTPRGGIRPHKKFSTTATRAEVLFVDYIGENLRKKGRAGIIVPEGIIFKAENSYKELRKKLINDWGLYAVVSLPQGIFNPYSGVKTSILFLDRGFSSNDILFVKVENDGYDLGAQRRKIDKNDLPVALSVIQQWKEKQSIPAECKALAHNVNKEKIAEDRKYNFTGGRYKETVDYRNAKYPMLELGEICEIYQPKTITSKQIKDSGRYKVFGANGIIGYFDKYNHEESEIAVTCRGATCGTVNLTDPQSWITGNAMVVKPKKETLDKKYLFYLLKNSDLNSTISGTAQPQITRAGISPYKIPFPPLEVQEQIAAEIDGYQKVIDGAKQVIANWKPQITIEPDWVFIALGEILHKEKNTINPNTKQGDIKYIGLENIQEHTGEIVGNVDGNYKSMKSAKNVFNGGEILYGKLRPNLNKVVFATYSGVCSTDILVLDGDSQKVNNKFFSMYLRNKKFNDEVLMFLRGAQLPRVTWQSMSTIKVPLPPIKKQNQIVAEIESEQRAITECKTLIAKMEQKITDKISELWEKS